MDKKTGGALELMLLLVSNVGIVGEDVEDEDDEDVKEVEESVFVAGFEAGGRAVRNTGGARIVGG